MFATRSYVKRRDGVIILHAERAAAPAEERPEPEAREDERGEDEREEPAPSPGAAP